MIRAACDAMLAEGDVSADLRAWRIPCLIHVAAGDVDFHEQARRAAAEIPGAQFISVPEVDHLTAHVGRLDMLHDRVRRMLRSA